MLYLLPGFPRDFTLLNLPTTSLIQSWAALLYGKLQSSAVITGRAKKQLLWSSHVAR